jgi:hypothetical protein
MSEKCTPLFDAHGAEVGTLIVFPDGTRRLSTDPRTYQKLEGGGYKLPLRIWPLFDREGEQVRLLEPVPGSENRTEAA